MTSEQTKLEILKKVEEGTLTIEEGADLLGIIENSTDEPPISPVFDSHSRKEPKLKKEVTGCMKAALSMIVVVGALLTAFSVFWIYQGYNTDGFSWGFWLSWIPLVIGLALIILGWALLESPWIHLAIRIKDENKQGDLDLSVPIPFNLAKWVFKTFKKYMPDNIKSIDFEGVIDQAEMSIKNGEPYQVQVDQEDGSVIEIQIN